MSGRFGDYRAGMTNGLTITDAETGEETYLGVRVVRDGVVGLAVSQRSGEELEVFLTGIDAGRLAELLIEAGTAVVP